MSQLPSLLPSSLGNFSTSIAFGIDRVTVLSNTALRLHYTAVPKASDPAGTNDALNPANYYLSALNAKIRQVVTVDGDPQSFDLLLTSKLANGTWGIVVFNIQTPLGINLSSTTSLSFIYNAATYVVPAGGGTINLGSESFLKRHLGKAFLGKAWNAVIAAIGAGDTANWTNAQLAFDQKFKISASGKYLDRKMSDDGIVRPSTLGISDDVFRRYGIKFSAGKLTSKSILDMLEVFYGADATRATATSGLAEPYAISGGDDLQLVLDEKTAVTILFDANDFSTPGAATALEVATALTRYFRQNNSSAYAIVYKNATTGTNFVKIYSAASGLASALRITGGKTQNVLKFNTPLVPNTIAAFPFTSTWAVTQPTPGTTRYTTTGKFNLYASSQDFTSTTAWNENAWASQAPTVVLLPNTIVAPDGTLTATDVIATGATFNYTGQTIIASGAFYTWSIWAKVPSGTQDFQFVIWDFSNSVSIQVESSPRTATTTWQRFTCTTTTQPVAGTRISGLIYPTIASGTPTNGRIHVWGAQFETGQVATDYVPTTIPKGVTNQLYYSEDFTNLVWNGNAHATITANTTADPKNGSTLTSTTADTYAVDGSGSGTAISQSFISNGGPYTASIWVKAISPSSIPFSINIRDLTQNKFLALDDSRFATTTWQRLSVSTSTSIAGNLCQVQLYINTNSASVAIWGAQLEDSASLRGPYSPTTSAWTMIGTSGSGIDLTQVRPGDYVNIYGSFNANNRGSFPITNISGSLIDCRYVQYFEVTAPTFTSEAAVIPSSINDMLFFRPTKSTLFNTVGAVSVNSTPTGLSITIPATTTVVSRAKYSGAYLQGSTAVTASSMVRAPNGVITVTTPTAHGLSVGQQVLIENSYASGTSTPAITPSSAGTTQASVTSFWSTIDSNSFVRGEGNGVIAADGTAYIWWGLNPATNGSTADSVKFKITGSTTLADGSIQYTYTQSSFFSYGGVRKTVTLLPPTSVEANKIVVAGGMSGTPPATALGTINLFDPATTTFTNPPPGISPRDYHTASYLPYNGKVIFIGGETAINSPLNTTDIYDPAINLVAAGPTMGMARSRHKSVVLRNGTVLVIGGLPVTGGLVKSTSTCEIYDPVSNTFSPTGRMNFGRTHATAVLLPDGRVLVAGGNGTNNLNPTFLSGHNTAEIYDPTTGSWSMAGQMSVTRAFEPWSVYLPSTNSIFVGGGLDSGGTVATLNIDVYDVASGTWSVSPTKLNSFRTRAVALLMNNGTILASGGETLGLSTPELYIPATSTTTYPKYASGKMNGTYQIVSVPSSTQFTVQSIAGYATSSSGATYTPLQAPVATTMAGPYVFEPRSGIAITNIASSVLGNLFANQKYNTLPLKTSPGLLDATSNVVVGYGTSIQHGPISVLGLQNSSTALIDPNYKFTANIPDGTSVVKLFNLGGYVPSNPQSVGSFYLTSSGDGRQAASAAIDRMVASGVNLTKTVLFPGDRGLGNESKPKLSVAKMSDVVRIFGGDNLDNEIKSIGGGI